jgi:hypothetical protein
MGTKIINVIWHVPSYNSFDIATVSADKLAFIFIVLNTKKVFSATELLYVLGLLVNFEVFLKIN